MVFFISLTMGVKVNESPEKGHATSAPIHPHLGIKALATTVVALLITGVLFYLEHHHILDLQTLVTKW